MIIWNSTKIKQRTLTVRTGSSVQVKFMITTWWFLFIPIFRNEKLISTQ